MLFRSGKAGQFHKVVQLLEEMPTRGLQHSAAVFSAAIAACEKDGQEGNVERLRAMQIAHMESMQARCVLFACNAVSASTWNPCTSGAYVLRIIQIVGMEPMHARCVLFCAQCKACM